ncbi:relaxase/mobilization nuclease domain-containing protein [Butyrivibrio sp. FC2001]|uniref:relaxase/mobilization nuclease domain-containing protein n=1 Tax=Butyrivibrio sp. FC2001 TaxID=1280671 RepID=UPI00047A9EDD|nr:relaxase/mobilization nuclease domain-containing protein [Butyrivibrio sp. FC2001]
MATTRIIAMHAHGGESVSMSLGLRTDYIKNPDKTEDEKYVSSYLCDKETVNEEFTFLRQMYDRNHTRKLGKNDVIAYQIRQAFKPGEIDPATANKLGYELAMRFTKGRHQFIVATHTDKKHIHNHIIYNSVNIDASRKFRDFLGSAKALRKVSDIICLENNLSVIDNPKKGKKKYGKWLGDHKKPSKRDYIRASIDKAFLEKPRTMEEFLRILKNQYDIDVDASGKYVKLKKAGDKKYARLDSLGEGYREGDVKKRIRGEYAQTVKNPSENYESIAGRRIKDITPNGKSKEEKLGLLIDVQKKISEGKGPGYEKWARSFNMKQTAKTLSFLSDLGIMSYEDLNRVHGEHYEKYNALKSDIIKIDSKMEKIIALQKAIISYAKTNDAYQKYKKSGYNKNLKKELLEEITEHEEARKCFKEYEGDKVPTIKVLKEQYAELNLEKSELYKTYNKEKRDYMEIAVAKKNLDIILDKDHDGVHDFLEKEDHEVDR